MLCIVPLYLKSLSFGIFPYLAAAASATRRHSLATCLLSCACPGMCVSIDEPGITTLNGIYGMIARVSTFYQAWRMRQVSSQLVL